ncbi:hypothetical protein HY620_00350 [Candidatus Uhrbacteria bacterium]|nr:hypothetical protein [Candidatus Uhrbacteria bacterium]
MLSISYAIALLITIVLEAMVVFLMTRGNRDMVFASIGINMITHPIFHFIVYGLLPGYRWPEKVYISEIVIILAEYLLLRHLFPSSAFYRLFGMSLVMNGISFIGGSYVFSLLYG